MSQTFILGMDAKLYFGATDTDLSGMTEVGNAKDLSLTMDAGEADITTRGNSGWRATAPTLRECTIEFEMIWKPGDAAFDAVKTAFLSAGTLELAALTGDKSASGSEGPKGEFGITGFTRNEALEEAITVSVTAKLAAFHEWVEVSGS